MAHGRGSPLPPSGCYYEEMVEKFPTVSIEDGLAEETGTVGILTQRLGKIQLTGDDPCYQHSAPEEVHRGSCW